MRHETKSLQESRLDQQIRANTGKGAQLFKTEDPPVDPLGATREVLAATINELRQRRLERATDAQFIASTRRLGLFFEVRL